MEVVRWVRRVRNKETLELTQLRKRNVLVVNFTSGTEQSKRALEAHRLKSLQTI